jgi:catechol 2,3-dioxygenase-like lactoylglutathione lyase family enzyme
MSARRMTQLIHGPIISSSDLETHRRLLTTFGMTEERRIRHDSDSCRAQWGTEDVSAIELIMRTPQTPYGARIIAFDPPSHTVVRNRERGFDADAPKVIDFYVPDLMAARRAVEAAGWKVREPVAEYDMPEGHFVEAHVWAPDEFVCAMIHGPKDFFRNFCVLTDRMFSEPQSLSGSVSDFDASIKFFERVLELEVVYRYGIEDDSFRQLVGSERPQFNLRAVNIGVSTREPYLGLIHYGMAAESFDSLQGRARPPHRGLLGATVIVADTDEVAARVARSGGTILAPPATIVETAWGQARCVSFLAANGGCYQAVQPTSR